MRSYESQTHSVFGFGTRCVLVSVSACFIAVLLGTVLAVGVASADPIVANLQPVSGVSDLLRDPTSYTIQQIIAAGGIVIGDKLFDSFTVTTSKSSNAIAPDASAITITPIQVLSSGAVMGGDYGMQINGAWSAPAGQLSDSTVEFHASILAPYIAQGYAFKDNSLWMTAFGVSNNTSGGAVSVSENLYATHPSSQTSPFSNKFVYYQSSANNQLLDAASFAPITDMWVVKDVVAYGGTGAVGAAHLSEFYQTFSQVPEPGTFVLLGMGLLGLACYVPFRRRASRGAIEA
jgi:hypothetical protein